MTALLRSVEHDRRVGWLLAGLVAAVAALLRLPALGRPHSLVFDETYYVKDAWTLLNLGYEAQWPDDANERFEAGDVHAYTDSASYVVHPPVGKWLIATGMRVLGAGDPAGWRLASALGGILAVLLVTRIARRLFRSTAAGAAAGLLLAVDGAAIVHSRIALLDGLLMVLVLAAFGALLIDRDHAHRRLAGLTAPPRAPTRWGPPLGLRPWRITAGVLLGLAVGTKWSALFFMAVFGLLTVGWDAAARRRAAVPGWMTGTALRDAPVAFVSVVGAGAVTYVASWWSWFRSPDAWGRTWAADHPGEGLTWLPKALRSLWTFHTDMWGFHTGLTSEHDYAAHPAGWLLQLRPTSFYYRSPEPAQEMCGADRCAEAVTSLGNPLVWWLGTLAVIACVWWVVRRRDGMAVAALAGIAAGWLPWFVYDQRTVFTFYAIVLLPWLVMCLAYAGLRLWRWGVRTDRAAPVAGVLVAAMLLILATTAFFWPVWAAETVPFQSWQLRMWLPGWV